MPNSDDIQNRIETLRVILNRDIIWSRVKHIFDHWLAIGLMAFTIGASIAAGVGALAFKWSAAETGKVALVPGFCAIVASHFKFEDKANWHSRKLDAMEKLKNKLLLELPANPSVDDVAAVSRARTKVIEDMQKEWERAFSFNFTALPTHH